MIESRRQFAKICASFIASALLIVSTSAIAQDFDPEKLAKAERVELAGCVVDALTVIEKHRLPHQLFSLWDLLEGACAIEVERVKIAAESQLKDDLYKKFLPGQLILGMFENASEIYKKRPLSSCSGSGCRLEEYRTCLVRRIPAELRLRSKPADFEIRSRQQCEEAESAARSALINDFDNVQKRHLAGGLDHRMNSAISKIVEGVHQEVTVFYAEDLVKVQPGRKSCKPEMCGASPCISLVEQPTEYQCAINQQ